jgi:hypothetical protein
VVANIASGNGEVFIFTNGTLVLGIQSISGRLHLLPKCANGGGSMLVGSDIPDEQFSCDEIILQRLTAEGRTW